MDVLIEENREPFVNKVSERVGIDQKEGIRKEAPARVEMPAREEVPAREEELPPARVDGGLNQGLSVDEIAQHIQKIINKEVNNVGKSKSEKLMEDILDKYDLNKIIKTLTLLVSTLNYKLGKTGELRGGKKSKRKKRMRKKSVRKR